MPHPPPHLRELKVGMCMFLVICTTTGAQSSCNLWIKNWEKNKKRKFGGKLRQNLIKNECMSQYWDKKQQWDKNKQKLQCNKKILFLEKSAFTWVLCVQ